MESFPFLKGGGGGGGKTFGGFFFKKNKTVTNILPFPETSPLSKLVSTEGDVATESAVQSPEPSTCFDFSFKPIRTLCLEEADESGKHLR